jgi:hypothetical protein
MLLAQCPSAPIAWLMMNVCPSLAMVTDRLGPRGVLAQQPAVVEGQAARRPTTALGPSTASSSFFLPPRHARGRLTMSQNHHPSSSIHFRPPLGSFTSGDAGHGSTSGGASGSRVGRSAGGQQPVPFLTVFQQHQASLEADYLWMLEGRYVPPASGRLDEDRRLTRHLRISVRLEEQ